MTFKRTLLVNMLLCLTLGVGAQEYVDQLKQQKAGQGTVTINQSQEIDELVNGKKTTKDVAKPAPQNKSAATQNKPSTTQQTKPTATAPTKSATTTPAKPATTTTKQNQGTPTPQDNKGSVTPAPPTQQQDSVPEQKEEPKKRKVIGYENNNITTEDGTTIVDTRKKVMRNAQKITGYRIQVYAGGNTRAHRVKAEQAGGKVKNAFPDQPVYVHFYSPRWICRMGNFRTYGEASKLLKQVKRLGYPQACIVKGKITVQY